MPPTSAPDQRPKRRIALPSFTAAAIRRQFAQTGHDAPSYPFATKTGRPGSVSNIVRLLRTFVDDNEHPLRDARIEVGEFIRHIFRRTATTLVEARAGFILARASRALGDVLCMCVLRAGRPSVPQRSGLNECRNGLS